jgi:hypothetical protein
VSFTSEGNKFLVKLISSEILLIADSLQSVVMPLKDFVSDIFYVLELIKSESRHVTKESEKDCSEGNQKSSTTPGNALWELSFVECEFILPKNSSNNASDVISVMVGFSFFFSLTLCNFNSFPLFPYLSQMIVMLYFCYQHVDY